MDELRTTDELRGSATTAAVIGDGDGDGDRMVAEDLLTFRLMHRGMRVDSAALVEALLRLPPGDRGAAHGLRSWFEAFSGLIEHHHTVEDEVFWPALRAVDPAFGRDEEVLVADHHELDRAMEAVAVALEGLVAEGAGPHEKAAAVAAARIFSSTIHVHLDREESTALEAAQVSIRRSDWLALEVQARASTERRAMTFIGPWLDDHATSEEAAQLMALVPWPVGVLVRGPWRRRYRRRAALVRAARRSGATGPGATGPGAGGGRALPLRSIATVGLLLGTAAAVVALTACGSDGSSAGATATTTAHEHVLTGAASVDGGTVEVTMHEYGFSPIEDTVAAGAVTLRAVNEGSEPHEVQIARPRAGVTAESFETTFREQGEEAAMAQVELLGGVHGVQPGDTVEGVTELTPGEYLLLCFFPAPDGTSHVVKGMVDSFEVTRGSERLAPPAADATIHAADFSLGLPADFTGKGVVELRNDGSVDHEVVFLRVDDGRTPADVFAWYGGDQTTPAPFRFTGGVAAVEAGGSASVRLDLTSGTYLAVCFVPTPDGTPHAVLGMISTFTVT